MRWLKRVMEQGEPPTAAQYATTPRGYPFPLRSWPPDAAIDIQNLAQALDTDIGNVRPAGQVGFAATASLPSGATKIATTATVTRAWAGMTWDNTRKAFAVPVAGLYQINTLANFTGIASGGSVHCGYGSDAASTAMGSTFAAGGAGWSGWASGSWQWAFDAGAWLSMWVNTNLAGPVAAQALMQAAWIGPKGA